MDENSSISRKVRIRFTKDWKIAFDEDSGEWMATRKYGYKDVTNAHYRRYYNALCMIAGIGGAARNLLEYMCERMDGNNIIHSNQAFRNQFKEDVAKWTKGEITYTDSAIKKGIHTLVKKGLVLKTGSRGTLQVNPEYFWKGDEEYRYDTIKMILDFPADGIQEQLQKLNTPDDSKI